MLKAFSTQQLVFIALMAALVFVVDFLLVTAIDAAAGTTGTGVLVDTIFVVALSTICVLAVPRFGTITLLIIIYAALVSPLNLFGPPGIYKIPFLFLLGLGIDSIFLLLRHKRLGYYLGFSVINAIFVPLLFLVLIWLGLPGAQELGTLAWAFMAIVFVESLIGVWIGTRLYDKKIKKMHFVKQLQG